MVSMDLDNDVIFRIQSLMATLLKRKYVENPKDFAKD